MSYLVMPILLPQNTIANKCNEYKIYFNGLTVKSQVRDGIYYFKAFSQCRFGDNVSFKIETHWERNKKAAMHFMRAVALQAYYSRLNSFTTPLVVEKDDSVNGLQYRAFYCDRTLFVTDWYDTANDCIHVMNAKLGVSYRKFEEESMDVDDDEDDGISVTVPPPSPVPHEQASYWNSIPEAEVDYEGHGIDPVMNASLPEPPVNESEEEGAVMNPNFHFPPISVDDAGNPSVSGPISANTPPSSESEYDPDEVEVPPVTPTYCEDGCHNFWPLWVDIMEKHVSECAYDCHTFCDLKMDMPNRNDMVCVDCGRMEYDVSERMTDLHVTSIPQMMKSAASLIPGVAEVEGVTNAISSIAQGISSLVTSDESHTEHAPAVAPQLGTDESPRTTQVAMETGIVVDDDVATVSRPGVNAVNERTHGIGVSNVPELMDRYFISTLNWSGTTKSTVLKIPEFPFGELAKQNNPSLLSFFSYLLAKMGVEITVTLNASPFHKGCMKVGIVYARSNADNMAYNDWQFGHMSGALFHASAGGTTSFPVKYFCVQNVLVIKRVTPSLYDNFAGIYFCPLVPLESVDGAQKNLTFNLNWKMTTFEFPTQLSALVPFDTATPHGAVTQNFVPVTGPSMSSTKDDQNFQCNLAESCKNETVQGDAEHVESLHEEFKNSFSYISKVQINGPGRVTKIAVQPHEGHIEGYTISPEKTLSECSLTWGQCLAMNYCVVAGFMEYKFVFVKGESCNAKFKLVFNFTSKDFTENEMRAAPGVFFDLTKSLEWTVRAPLISPFSAIPLSQKYSNHFYQDLTWHGCRLELWCESELAYSNNVPPTINVLVFSRVNGCTFMQPNNVTERVLCPYYGFANRSDIKESRDLESLLDISQEIPHAIPQAPVTQISSSKFLPDSRFYPGTVLDPLSCDGQMKNLTRNTEAEPIDLVMKRPFRRLDFSLPDKKPNYIHYTGVTGYPPPKLLPDVQGVFYSGTQRDTITMACVGMKADTRMSLVARNLNVLGVAGRFAFGKYVSGSDPVETSLGSDFELWNTQVNRVMNVTLPFNNVAPFVTGGIPPSRPTWAEAFENYLTFLSVENVTGAADTVSAYIGWENLKCFMPQCPPLSYSFNVPQYIVYEWQTETTAIPQIPWKDVVVNDPYLRQALQQAAVHNHSVLHKESPSDPTLDHFLKDLLEQESNFSFTSESTADVVYPESLNDIVSIIKLFSEMCVNDDVCEKLNVKLNVNFQTMYHIQQVAAAWEKQGKVLFRTVFKYYVQSVWKMRSGKITHIDSDMNVTPDVICKLIADRSFNDATTAVLMEAGSLPARQSFLLTLFEKSGISHLISASRRVMQSMRNNVVDPSVHILNAIASRSETLGEFQIRQDESLWSYILRLCEILYPNLLTSILPLGHFMLEGPISHKVLAVVTVCASLGLIKIEHITLVITQIVNFCTSFYHYLNPFSDGATALPNADRSDEIFDRFKNVCMCVLPLVAGTLGFKADSWRGWFAASARALRDGLVTAGSLPRIFTFCVDSMKSFIRWCINEKAPEVVAQEQLAAVSEELCDWAKNVCDLCLPHMYDAISADRALQARVMELRKKGHEYMNLMRDESTEYFRHFIRFKHLVETCYQEVCLRQGNNVPRIDPVCVWMYGPPGVGKTTLMKRLVLDMLLKSGVSHTGDAVYTYSPLTEYSNGYCGQPGLLLDDIFAINSQAAMEKSLTFFHNLNSSISLNANMAALEDKHKTLHPYVAGVTANSFTISSASIVDKGAFNRRRDIVVRAKFSPAFLEKYPGVTTASDFRVDPKDLENNAHLQFNVHQNSHTDAGYVVVGGAVDLKYEQLKEFLCDKAKLLIERRLVKWQNDNTECENYLAENTQGSEFVRGITAGAQVTLRRIEEDVESVSSFASANESQNVNESVNESVPSVNGMQSVNGVTDESANAIGQMPMGVSMDDVDFVGNSLRREFTVSALMGGAISAATLIRPTYRMLRELRTTIREDLNMCVCSGSSMWSNNFEPTPSCPCIHYFISTSMTFCRQHRMFVDLTCRNKISAVPCTNCEECALGDEYRSTWLTARADNRRLAQLPVEDLSDIGQPAVLPIRTTAERFRTLIMNVKKLSLGVWGWFKENCKNGRMICAAFGLAGVIGALNLWRNYVAVDNVSLVEKGIRNGAVEDRLCGLAIPPEVMIEVKKGKNLKNLIFQPATPQSGTYSGPGVPRVPPVNHVLQNVVNATPQAPSMEAFKGENLLLKNMLFMVLPAADGLRAKVLRVFMVGGQVGIMPAHFCKAIREYPKAVIYSFFKQSAIVVETKDLQMFALQTDDIGYVIIPLNCGTFPVRSGCFVDEHNRDRISDDVVLYEVDINGGRVVNKISQNECESVTVNYKYPNVKQMLLRGYNYKFAKDGLCGAILFDVKHQKILGIHVQTHTQTRFPGVAAIVTRGLAEQLVSGQQVLDRVYPPTLEEEPRVDVLPPGHMVIGKSVYAKQQIAGKNQIVRSELFDSLSENVRVREPVKFAREGDRFPGEQAIKIGVAKQFDFSKPFEEEAYQDVRRHLSEWLIRQVVPIGKVQSVRSLYEGVMGIENNEYAVPLDFSTSMGYPWLATHHGAKKKSFFTFNQKNECIELVGMNVKLYQMIEEENEMRVNGIVPPTVFVDFLKDETLKPGKDPRLVNASSCQATIAHRMFLLDFMSALRASRHPGCAVGTNMDSKELEAMVMEMFIIGDSFVDGDYKDFGPRIDPRLVKIVFECVNDWYEFHGAGEFNVARSVIAEEVGQAIHLVGDALFQTTIGSPSGFAFTAEMNSLANLLYLLLAYRKTVGSLLTFHNNVYVETYGDDLLMSVSERVRDVFNACTLSLFFKEHGIRFTDAQKNEGVNACPYDDIDKVTFLKREFKFMADRDPQFRAALPVNIIEEIPLYIKGNVPRKQMKEHLAALLFTSLYHAHSRGPDYYNRLRVRYLRVVSQHKLNCDLPLWDDIENLKFRDTSELGHLAASLLNGFMLGQACAAHK